MNILITGCAGFIGSHTVDHFLEDSNYNIVGVDKLTYASNLGNLKIANIHKNFTFYEGDICNFSLIKAICENHKISCIINFAAETHVDNSIDDASNFIKSNIGGVHSILEVCKDLDILLFHISTDEVYGVADRVSFTEDDRLNPKNPYSATKAAAEHLIISYRNTFKTKSLMVRPSNNFGPRQHSEKFMPTILTNLENSKKIPIYGNGKQVREWTYVKDTARAIKYILENALPGECYNISSNIEMENLDLVKKICKILRKDFESSISYVEDRLGHDIRYSISNTKLQNLGFKEYSGFEKSIRDTILFFRNKEE